MAYSCVKVIFEIGHEAALRNKRTQEGFTHDWEVFVRGADNTDIHYFIDKVVFHLHETFHKPKRVIKDPPYKVKESGYAGFSLPIDIYVKSKDEPRKIKFNYDLTLQHSGPPISNIIREKYVFNNPSEDFRRNLIKGGGIGVGSESLTNNSHGNASVNSVSSTANSESKIPSSLSSKSKPSSDSQSLKKHKVKEPSKADDVKPSNSFAALFGTPIKTVKKENQQVAKPSSKSGSVEKHSSEKQVHLSDKSSKHKNGAHKEKTLVSSKKDHEKDKDKEKEKDKEKDREKDKEKKKEREREKEKEKEKDKEREKEKDRDKEKPKEEKLQNQQSSKEKVNLEKSQNQQNFKEEKKKEKQEKQEKHEEKLKEHKEKDPKEKADKSGKSHSELKLEKKKERKKEKEKEREREREKEREREREREREKEKELELKKEKEKEKERESDKTDKVKLDIPISKEKESVKRSPKIPIIKEEKLEKVKETKGSEKERPAEEEKEKHRHHKHKKKEKQKKEDSATKEKTDKKLDSKQSEIKHSEIKKPSPAPIPRPSTPELMIKPEVPSPKKIKNPLGALLDELSDKSESDALMSSEEDEPSVSSPPPSPPPPVLPPAIKDEPAEMPKINKQKDSDSDDSVVTVIKKKGSKVRERDSDSEDSVVVSKKRAKKSSKSDTTKEVNSTKKHKKKKSKEKDKEKEKEKEKEREKVEDIVPKSNTRLEFSEAKHVESEQNNRILRSPSPVKRLSVKEERKSPQSWSPVSPELKFTDEYVTELKNLQRKIMTLEDDSELQKVVQVIAETGQYEITKETFDFDLCSLDKTTVQKLQNLFLTAPS